jgi:mono/diheme cytochrome c family protein
MRRRIAIFSVAALVAAGAGAASAAEDAGALYREHCAACHGADRLGATAPALIPESLARQKPEQVRRAIAEGRPQTQMPAFGAVLSEDEIDAVAHHVQAPLGFTPAWGEAEIEASREPSPDYRPADSPVFEADPLNLFVVVEAGDHHVTILDGDAFEPLARFASRIGLHGGPKFTPDGRFVFFMSRDGWVTKYDLWSLQTVAEARAGINSRNIAISADGRWLAVANYLPHSLVILAADDLGVARIFEAKDLRGTSSRVSAVYQARPRDSFIVALKDVPEIWEVATDPTARPVYPGLVHSYEKGMEEGLGASSGLFALRRIAVPEPLDDFFFDPDYRHLIGSARDGHGAVVVNLIVGRPIAEVDLPGLPHLGSGISWERNGRRVVATPHLREGRVSIIDMDDWSLIKSIDTLGPGFFMRSHANSRFAWADVFFGPHRDVLHLIDKETLEIVHTLRPEPGKTAAHVEFDRSGRHALVSIWEEDGALVIYDSETLEEAKRIPMRKPSGKYNVWNKITFEDGTSH